MTSMPLTPDEALAQAQKRIENVARETITYPNGTVLKAIVLSHEEHEIRAIAPGCDDALAFSCIRGTRISEEFEPVTIEFEWQRRTASPHLSEDDVICSNEVAARLIQTLFRASEVDEAGSGTLFVFGPERSRFAIHGTEPEPRKDYKRGVATVD
jgi:hypothetical protein